MAHNVNRLPLDDPLVFISYAKEDRTRALKLYRRLSDENLRPWLDRYHLRPGQEWESVIPRIIKRSRFFIVLICAYITDVRISQRDDLSSIRGIRENFLITGDCGIKDHFTDSFPICADRCASEDRPVFQHQDRRLAQRFLPNRHGKREGPYKAHPVS